MGGNPAPGRARMLEPMRWHLRQVAFVLPAVVQAAGRCNCAGRGTRGERAHLLLPPTFRTRAAAAIMKKQKSPCHGLGH